MGSERHRGIRSMDGTHLSGQHIRGDPHPEPWAISMLLPTSEGYTQLAVVPSVTPCESFYIRPHPCCALPHSPSAMNGAGVEGIT